MADENEFPPAVVPGPEATAANAAALRILGYKGAPVYKPGKGPGLDPSIMKAQPFQSPWEYEAQAAKMRAQQLTNDNNQIRVDETERALAEEAAIREAITSAYATGGENGQPITRNQGFDIASEAAFAQGNIDRAVQIERAMKTRTLDQPYGPQMSEAIRVATTTGEVKPPANSTPSDLAALVKAAKQFEYSAQLQDTRDKRKRANEVYIPGIAQKAEINEKGDLVPGGIGPDKRQAKDWEETHLGVSKAEQLTNALEKSVRENGAGAWFGGSAAEQRAIIGDLVFTLKGEGFYNLGAAFTDPEIRLLLTQLPVTWSDPNVSAPQFIKEFAFNRDPMAVINRLKRNFKKMKSEANRMYKLMPKEFEPEGPPTQGTPSIKPYTPASGEKEAFIANFKANNGG